MGQLPGKKAGDGMAWISVYQEVDGPKLRRLSKALNTCKAEALGILNFLWFWGMVNADETGKVLEADRTDIEDALAGVTRINTASVVDSLFEAGWLDSKDGCIIIHDWDTWQEQWYKLQKTRKDDAERKRKARENEMKQKSAGALPKPPTSIPTTNTADKPTDVSEGSQSETEAPSAPPPTKPKNNEPKKVKYADYVLMTEASYEKLKQMYGKRFTDTCIAELDYYKGEKGKTYKDDYRAILRWVVDRCKEKYPGLLQKSKAESVTVPSTENPYEGWDDDA